MKGPRVAATVAASVIALLSATLLVTGQSPAPGTASGGTTPWGAPDLQGIWTHPYVTPLQRPPEFADKAVFTEEERAKLDRLRAGLERRDRRAPLGSLEDLAGSYGKVWLTVKPTGKQTSQIVDPPDGKLPPFTPAVQKRNADIRAFQRALLQTTDSCKQKIRGCTDGPYGPRSPLWDQPYPYYGMTANRHDNPEELSLGWRCLTSALPPLPGSAFGVYQRIVQSPDAVSIYYDIGQGQGFQRVIPIDLGPHLTPKVRQWWGDSRGRWEGNTLVVDVTNFTNKTDFQGSRENLHLVERWTRTDANTIEYVVTLEDATAWTRPWTAKHEMIKQDNRANRIYYEPRCHEGKDVDSNEITGSRAVEKAFSEGRGPDPATIDTTYTGGGQDMEDNRDPLGGAG